VDGSDNLYIADLWDYRVRKVSFDGIITTVAGNGTQGYSGDGGSAASAQLNVPAALAVDAAGNLFIADTYNNRIRMVSPAGIITTVAGDGTQGYSGDAGPATRAQFGSISGLAIDSNGNLYVADQLYNTIRLLQPVSSASNGEAGRQ
jgi:sugar lactone lactonase YvrE